METYFIIWKNLSRKVVLKHVLLNMPISFLAFCLCVFLVVSMNFK